MKDLEEKGFQVLKGVVSTDLLDHLYDGIVDELLLVTKEENVFMTEHGPKQIQHLDKIEVPEVKEFFDHVAKILMDASGLKGKILNMQVFVKYPDYKITAPHQDGAYLEAPDKKIVTFWVPLHDITLENSCMCYVEGSHKEGLLPHENIGTTVRNRTGKVGYSLVHTQRNIATDYTPVTMSKGDILIHDQFCLHLSSKNTADKPRKAITMILEVE